MARKILKDLSLELDEVVRKYVRAYSITGAELIGTLEILKATWMEETKQQVEEDENT